MSEQKQYAPPTKPFWRSQLGTLREPIRMGLRVSALAKAPRGSMAVMVFPGYSTDDRITAPLRRYLRSRGHLVSGWGLGRNRGDVAGDIDAVRAQVEQFHDVTGDRPVALIGWSLGGVFAREIARDDPTRIAQVVTIATPVFGGPRFTTAASDYSLAELDEISATTERRNLSPIDVPITAFFSKNDGVVDWRTCIDDVSPALTTVEVSSTHVGITLDPTVWLRIAQLLAD